MDQRWGVGAASPANGGTFQPLRSGTLTRFPIRLSMYAGADLQSIPGDGRYLQSSVNRFAAFFLSASVSFSAWEGLARAKGTRTRVAAHVDTCPLQTA